MLAVAMLAWTPLAQAQFFWSPFFQEQPKRQKIRPAKPKPPADDLPPIVPKESSIPPPPDDRPYDAKLLRLAEILGAVHYLRELCGAQEGQLWREQMKEIVKNEGSTAVRRAKLVNSFNDGYRGYRRTYRTCTSSATLAITRFSAEGAQIAAALAKPSHYASRGRLGRRQPPLTPRRPLPPTHRQLQAALRQPLRRNPPTPPSPRPIKLKRRPGPKRARARRQLPRQIRSTARRSQSGKSARPQKQSRLNPSRAFPFSAAAVSHFGQA